MVSTSADGKSEWLDKHRRSQKSSASDFSLLRPSELHVITVANQPPLGPDVGEKIFTTLYIPGSNFAMASACSRYGDATGFERIAR